MAAPSLRRQPRPCRRDWRTGVPRGAAAVRAQRHLATARRGQEGGMACRAAQRHRQGTDAVDPQAVGAASRGGSAPRCRRP